MDNSKDFFLIIGIIIAFFVLAFFAKNIDIKSPAERQYVPTSDRSSSIRRTSGSNTYGDQRQLSSIESEIEKVKKELSEVEAELEKLQRFGEKSPYEGMVTIRKSTIGPKSTDVNKEYITLKSSSNISGVVISNWRLESEISGVSVPIGKASDLIYSGQVNVEDNIILRGGETVYITTGRSPIGKSFRINMCSGYFSQFQKFTPGLKRSCPLPEDEILFYENKTIFTDNECMDFVDRMSRCEIYEKQLPVTLSNACQTAIVQEINYNSCVDHHKDEPGFKKPEWRIFIKRDEELWREKREIIKLLDENKKIVDIFSY